MEWAVLLNDAYRVLKAKKVRPALETLTSVLALLFPSAFSLAHAGLDNRRAGDEDLRDPAHADGDM